MDLFIEPNLEFEKVAAEVALPEDPNTWPTEILQELHKHLPFIADFDPRIVMDRVDAERGYALGHVEVMNKTEIQAADPRTLEAAGVNEVRIPIVVKGNKLMPFDLLVTPDSKILPLTEQRLRMALFRPQMFDTTGRSPGDQSMVSMLYPPYRQAGGMGGMEMGKAASDKTANQAWQRALKAGKISAHDVGDAVAHSFPVRSNPGATAENVVRNISNSSPKQQRNVLGLYGRGPADKVDTTVAVNEMLRKSGSAKTAQDGDPRAAYSPIKLNGQDGKVHDVYVHPSRHNTEDFSSFHEVRIKHKPSGETHNFAVHPDDLHTHGWTEKKASLLQAILPTIEEGHFQSFGEKLANDQNLLAAFDSNIAAKGAMEVLSGYEPGLTQKTAAALVSAIRPTVAQLAHGLDGYTVKMASNFFWEPDTKTVDRGRAVSVFGEKVVLAADMNGSVTMVDGAEAPEDDEVGEQVAVVHEYGIYKCQGTDGKEYVGFVFPNLIDSTGLPTSTQLFTNGSQVSVQAEIAGVQVGEGAALFEGRGPKGIGAFYRVNEGKTECTIPFKVRGQISERGEVGFSCETYDGRPVKLMVQQGVSDVTEVEPGVTLIPDDFRWMPLEQAENVSLVGSAEETGKEASANSYMRSVSIRAGGHDSYSISGPPVDKLASAERDFVSYDDALFLLGGLGVRPEFAQKKLAQAAAFSAPISVTIGREIQTSSNQKTAALKKAHAFHKELPNLRRDLMKEAAVMTDPTAIDTVLSLGFLNPENVMTFVSYLPQIDQSQSKLCEVLLAARLGMKEVPVSALERAIKATEEVVEGLRVLAFQKM